MPLVRYFEYWHAHLAAASFVCPFVLRFWRLWVPFLALVAPDTPSMSPGLAELSQAVASAFASDSVAGSVCQELQTLSGASHLSLHIVERQHQVCLASGNMLVSGLLTTSLYPQGESLIGSGETLGPSPKLWLLEEDKRT